MDYALDLCLDLLQLDEASLFDSILLSCKALLLLAWLILLSLRGLMDLLLLVEAAKSFFLFSVFHGTIFSSSITLLSRFSPQTFSSMSAANGRK